MDEAKVIKVIKGKEKVASNLREDLERDSIEQDGVIRGEVYSASAKARELLHKAQQESEEILRKAKEQSEALGKSGYDAGYQEGIAQTVELMTKARMEHEQFLKNANRDVMDLAFKVAEKIIGKQLETDRKRSSALSNRRCKMFAEVKNSRFGFIRMMQKFCGVTKRSFWKLSGGTALDIMEDKKVQPGRLHH